MSQQLIALVQKSSLKPAVEPFEIGDTVDVHTRILEGEKERIQIFNGVVIARAGAGTIFEIAAWGLPAILVPIPEPTSHDQTKNAFSYARSGAAVVIEQNNLTPGLLISEISRILEHEEAARKMGAAARSFARVDAAKSIAVALLDIALSHEK
jgi:UDP:flavonoid glycosyltransferase YjiC (YdhE family)